MFEVEYIDAAILASFFRGYSYGLLTNLAAIQDYVASENGRQVDLIKKLNKEL
jgi:hypothetical protein